MQKKEWYKSLPVVLCLIGTVIVIGIFIYLWTRKTLSVNDSVLLNIITVVISVGISLYLGRYFSYEQARKRIEGEATKALRRIVRIKESTLRLQESCVRMMSKIDEDYEGMGEQKLLLEYFQGIHAQLSDLKGNVVSSIEDWGDMLPEEVQGLKRVETEELELLEQKLDEVNKVIEEAATQLNGAEGMQKELIEEALENKFQHLESEFSRKIDQMRKELSPTISAPDLLWDPTRGLSPVSKAVYLKARGMLGERANQVKESQSRQGRLVKPNSSAKTKKE